MPARVHRHMASNRIIRKLLHTWFLLRRPMTLGVRLLVEDNEGKILLVRHTYVDGWYFPGGGVEKGESQQQAAKKELREETGIGCTGELELVGIYQNSSASRRDHVSLFRCREWREERIFTPNREIAEIRFFSVNELPKDTTPATFRRIEEVYRSAAVSEFW